MLDGYEGWLKEISDRLNTLSEELRESQRNPLTDDEKRELRVIIGKYAVDRVMEQKLKQQTNSAHDTIRDKWMRVGVIVSVISLIVTAILTTYNSFFGVSHPVIHTISR